MASGSLLAQTIITLKVEKILSFLGDGMGEGTKELRKDNAVSSL